MAVIVYNNGTKNTAIVFDATLSEAHSESSEAPEHPVETGGAVVDNVRAKPTSIRLEALVTDAPLQASGGFVAPDSIAAQTRSAALAPSQGRAFRVYQELDLLRRNGSLVSVESGLKRYPSMVITDLSTTRDSTLRNALRISVAFKEVRTVTTQSVSIALPRTRKAQPTKKGGPDAGKDAADQAKKKESFLKYLAKAAS